MRLSHATRRRVLVARRRREQAVEAAVKPKAKRASTKRKSAKSKSAKPADEE